MITVFNQTETPWETHESRDQVLRFFRTKKSIRPGENGQEESKSRTLSVISHVNLFESVDILSNQINEAVSMKKKNPVVVSDKTTDVIFNRKGFHPFITGRDAAEEKRKDVLIGTLDTRGSKVLSIQNEKTFMLEYVILGGEASFITSFNELGSKFTVELFNTKTKQVHKYTFELTEKGITTKYNRSQREEGVEKFPSFKKFRPSRPTHIILTQPVDKATLLTFINKDQHEVIEITKTNQDDEVARLKALNYRAVTVFANVSSEQNADDARAHSKYKRLTNSLLDHFQTVFKLHSDNRIKKVQF